MVSRLWGARDARVIVFSHMMAHYKRAMNKSFYLSLRGPDGRETLLPLSVVFLYSSA